MLALDLRAGETYRLINRHKEIVCDFVEAKRSGKLVFENQCTGRRFRLAETLFAEMRSEGKAIRLRHLKNGSETTGFDPRVVLDPLECQISRVERDARQKTAWKYDRARTLHFYAEQFDKHAGHKTSTSALTRLIRSLRKEAREEGFVWELSSSTLSRALRIGEPGNRTVRAYYEHYYGHDPGARWPPFTLQLKEEAIAYFYSSPTVEIEDGVNRFLSDFDKEAERRIASGQAPLARPSRETVRLWIRKAESEELCIRKWGRRAGLRRYGGQSQPIEADRILQYVIFDHTMIDAWARIVDQDGHPIFAERPWLVVAMDVRSRAILAAIITFEPPSLLTIMQAVKQVVRRKTFLIAQYGDHKGATDCYGKPDTVLVDNAWENTGRSFKACLENAGISVIWAPVFTPEYKSYCERFFKTLNDCIWHKLESGIPFKPHEMSLRKLDPKAKAELLIEQLQALVWDFIVTIYHVEVSNGIGCAPALEWRRFIRGGHRPMIDDVRSLDRLFGGVVTCQLTTRGITHEGHRFHDPRATTELLDSLLRFSKRGQQRRSSLSTGSVMVTVTKDPSDCSYVEVSDFNRKRFVRLPNVDRNFSAGCDWHTARLVREHAEQENIAFHSDEEKAAARDAFRRKLEPKIKNLPYREARKLVPSHRRELRLVPGDTIFEALVEPSVTGLESHDLPMNSAMRYRDDEGYPAKGHRRGGKKATRASLRGKRRAAAAKVEAEARATTARRSSPASPETPRNTVIVDDPQALLKGLAEDLD